MRYRSCLFVCLFFALPAYADRVDVELLLYHAEEHPETGEPCGGAFAGPGLTQLNIFFDNIEFNARDEQERWPERAFPRIEPGDGGRLSVELEWSPGNPGIGLQPGIQSNYAVRIGWTDRDVLASDRVVNLPPHRIVSPRTHYITRNGWTTQNPGNDLARHGVIVCNRPPATITTTSIFEDRDPGSVFLGWRHTGGLGQARDWSRLEDFLEPQPELPRFGRPVYTQAVWGTTVTTVRDLDCGQYFACYRSFDDYGHVWEGCDGAIEVERCVEPDMAVPDMAVPDMAVPDMAPDAAPDMAPDMPVLMPDMAPPVPDMALPVPDMAPPVPDMAPPVPDLAPPVPDLAEPVPDLAPPVPDMAPAVPDMAPPVPDMAAMIDASPPDMRLRDMRGDDAPETGVPPPDAAGRDQSVNPRADMRGDDAPETGVDEDEQDGGMGSSDLGDPTVTEGDDCAQRPGAPSGGFGLCLLLLAACRRQRGRQITR
jgi:hypothetical protein